MHGRVSRISTPGVECPNSEITQCGNRRFLGLLNGFDILKWRGRSRRLGAFFSLWMAKLFTCVPKPKMRL